MTGVVIAGGHVVRGGGPYDLQAEARRLAKDRKVVRLLDGVSNPPFVAALTAFASIEDEVNRDEVALFTVSSWEPWLPEAPAELVDADHHTRYKYCFGEAHQPTAWLRGLANNTLCQIAIAGRFRAANLHVVGRAAALGPVLELVSHALTMEGAAAALIVAFDPAGDAHALPDETTSNAAAVALLPSNGPGARSVSALAGIIGGDAGAFDVVAAWVRHAAITTASMRDQRVRT
ncbi:MAG: hypothetical protein ACYDH6_19635 [Acidimicrobiales bacterium]